MDILPSSDPILREVIAPFGYDWASLRPLAFEMWRAMAETRVVPDDNGKLIRISGMGLAAPQVGERIRMFVMQPPGTTGFRNALVCINPVIVMATPERYTDGEMCLSSGGRVVQIERSRQIVAEWIDLKGDRRRGDMRGTAARVFQHEVDHLNGVGIWDYEKPALCDDVAASPAATVAPI